MQLHHTKKNGGRDKNEKKKKRPGQMETKKGIPECAQRPLFSFGMSGQSVSFLSNIFLTLRVYSPVDISDCPAIMRDVC